MSVRAAVSKWIRQTPLKWHLRNKVTRIEVIQRAIDRLGARRYLEIGVADGECFCSVRVAEKIGVDPIPPEPAVARELGHAGVSYHQCTSDAFFAGPAASAMPDGVDVVFVDGLHTDAQAYRDCVNALRHLRPGGVILMHDNLPLTEQEAQPAATYDEAWRLNGEDWTGLWTGDGWKAIIRVRALHDDAGACVLDCDHGLGVVWAGATPRVIAASSADIDAMTYHDLVRDPGRLLGLCAPRTIDDILSECQRRRHS